MPNPFHKRLRKPGFLLIETMCAFLLLIVASSIMAFYAAFVQKQQKNAANRIEALGMANQAIDQLKEGLRADSYSKKYQVAVNQSAVTIEWDDGSQEKAWLAQVRVAWHDSKPIILQTLLAKKAL